jgi:Flp pilus assembly protein TadD
MTTRRKGPPNRSTVKPAGDSVRSQAASRSKPSPPAPSKSFFSTTLLWACLALVALNVFIYGPVLHHDFVSLDDPDYVTQNVHISDGITAAGIAWAFSAGHAGNWHPITWISHMLDVQFYGMSAGGHHLTSLLFHIANSIFLLLLLYRMTDAAGPSIFVAALFAVHPAHVESVAWVAERKDVLSTFFWILTLWTYIEYVRRPGRNRYLLMLILYAAGLMSKPMIVTLPFVLLLLDVWPLRRIDVTHFLTASELKTLLIEKVPLFGLAAASSLVTFLVQQRSGYVQGLGGLPLASRITNALVSYVAYVVEMLWPAKLAVYYPYNLSIPSWKVLAAVLFLIGATIAVFRFIKRYPFLTVGWLWYVGTLLPVIGVIQVGEQSMADRYTYIPSIGLFFIVAWGVNDLLSRRPQLRRILPIMAAGTLLPLTLTARNQVSYWENSISLWTRTLSVTTGNYVAHNHMAYNLRQAGRRVDAIAEYNRALQIKPDFALAHEGLGVTLTEEGQFDEAIRHLNEAQRFMMSGDPEAKANTELALLQAQHKAAMALAAQGKMEDAIRHLNEVLRLKPDYAEAHNNLGFALTTQGNLDAAATHFMEAIRLRPDLYNAHYGLAAAFQKQGRIEDAIREYSEALRVKPDYAEAQRQLDALRRASGKN